MARANGYEVVTVDGCQAAVHRLVWEVANGPIPKGFHIHHKDRNRLNNELSNLELVHRRDHARLHMLQRIAVMQPILQAARRATIEKLKPVRRECSECGVAFVATGQPGRRPATMCSQKCRHRQYERTHRADRSARHKELWRIRNGYPATGVLGTKK